MIQAQKIENNRRILYCKKFKNKNFFDKTSGEGGGWQKLRLSPKSSCSVANTISQRNHIKQILFEHTRKDKLVCSTRGLPRHTREIHEAFKNRPTLGPKVAVTLCNLGRLKAILGDFP